MKTGKKYKDYKMVVGHGIALRPNACSYIRRFFLVRRIKIFEKY